LQNVTLLNKGIAHAGPTTLVAKCPFRGRVIGNEPRANLPNRRAERGVNFQFASDSVCQAAKEEDFHDLLRLRLSLMRQFLEDRNELGPLLKCLNK